MIVSIDDLIDGHFNFDFSKVNTRFKYLDCSLLTRLKSLKGCPDVIEGDMVLTGCSGLSSLEYAPKEVYGKVLISGTSITSLKGIGVDYFQEIRGSIYLPNWISSNMLGLLKIKHLTHVNYWSFKNSTNVEKVCTIINKHLKSDKDIAKCRQELIDAGFKEYARF